MRRALVWAGLILALLLLGACTPIPDATEGKGTEGLTIIGRANGLYVIRDSLRGVTCWVASGTQGPAGIDCIERPDSTTPAW